MNCSCEIDSCDGEYSTGFQDTKHHKARKNHVCYECRELIPIGDIYEKVSGIWDGKFYSMKICHACTGIRDEFFKSWNYGTIIDEFYNFIDDADGDISEDCLARLQPKSREKALKLLELYFENNEEE